MSEKLIMLLHKKVYLCLICSQAAELSRAMHRATGKQRRRKRKENNGFAPLSLSRSLHVFSSLSLALRHPFNAFCVILLGLRRTRENAAFVCATSFGAGRFIHKLPSATEVEWKVDDTLGVLLIESDTWLQRVPISI